jgi:tocopherol O-methyltransferase
MEESGELTLDGQQSAVARYYRETWLDYRMFWLNKANLAMHFGYWDETTRTHAQSLVRTNEVMADAVNIGPGDRVLDAGCGVGGSSIWLATERGATVVGVSISPDQIRLGRRFVAERGLQDRVSLFHRDYRETGLAAESFDVVWACESFAHAPDQRACLAEAYRVLKPGGRLIVRDIYERRRPADVQEERLMQTWYSAWVLPELPTLDRFLSWLPEAGFIDVSSEDVTARSERSGQRLYKMGMVALPFSALAHRLGLRSDVQHGNVVGPLAAWRGYRKGLWTAAHTRARRPGG